MTIVALAEQPPALRSADRMIWRTGERFCRPEATDRRVIPEETPIAFSYEGVSYAVMMATPSDLEDFAVGFSITEGLVASAEQIAEIEIISTDAGILLRISLNEVPAAAFWKRRRYLAGPTGCGLCGLESLAQANRCPPPVTGGVQVRGEAIVEAMRDLPSRQLLNQLTGALHAAAFWTPRDGIIAVREDVGRHNALDKLIGAATGAGLSAADGAILLTSRVSVEMVQKTASVGSALMAAVSAPTALAVRAADAARITLVAVARRDGFEIFTHPARILRQCIPLVASTEEGAGRVRFLP